MGNWVTWCWRVAYFTGNFSRRPSEWLTSDGKPIWCNKYFVVVMSTQASVSCFPYNRNPDFQEQHRTIRSFHSIHNVVDRGAQWLHVGGTNDGRNQIAIRFNRYLNCNKDSIQTLRDSIQETCDLNRISKSWLKLNTHSHYSLLSQILSSNVWFYPSLMYARNNYPRRARSAAIDVDTVLTLDVCLYVCMYVSALERKRLIGMTWNSEP